MSAITAGTCRHCGCTEECACRLSTGDPCWWTNTERTVCSNPSCISAEIRRLRAEGKTRRELQKAARRLHGDRFVGRGYGAICMELRKDARERARRRKGIS